MFYNAYDEGLEALSFFNYPIVMAFLLLSVLISLLVFLKLLKVICEKIFRIEFNHSELTEFGFLSGCVLAFTAVFVHMIFARFGVDASGGIDRSARSLNTAGIMSYYLLLASSALIILSFVGGFVKSLSARIDSYKDKRKPKHPQNTKKSRISIKKEKPKKEKTQVVVPIEAEIAE